jgi:hypothetical protein
MTIFGGFGPAARPGAKAVMGGQQKASRRAGPAQKMAPIQKRPLSLQRSTAQRAELIRQHAATLLPRPAAAALLWWPKRGGIWYFDIPSPNTTLFSVLWPPSIALWGPWCPPIPWRGDKKHLQVPEQPIYGKMVGLRVPNMLTMGSPHTKPPPYEFLNLYGACLHPGTKDPKNEVVDNLPRY